MSQSWVMFTGSVLFMISDCIIGINMFYTKVDNSQVRQYRSQNIPPKMDVSILFQFWIMSTYQLAQTLIMLSSLSH